MCPRGTVFMHCLIWEEVTLLMMSFTCATLLLLNELLSHGMSGHFQLDRRIIITKCRVKTEMDQNWTDSHVFPFVFASLHIPRPSKARAALGDFSNFCVLFQAIVKQIATFFSKQTKQNDFFLAGVKRATTRGKQRHCIF